MYVGKLSFIRNIIKIYSKIIFSNVKKDEETTYSSLIPLMSVIARLDAYRVRVRYFLRSFGAASFSSLKNGFPTFCTEEKFDAGDWKVLCGTTCRRRLANNREITRRFCLFSRVSVTSVHARFCACQHRMRWNQTPLFIHRAFLLNWSKIRVQVMSFFCILYMLTYVLFLII